MRIKTKLNLVTGFLFLVIVVFGILSLVSIHRLKADSGNILRNNYETLLYCNAMNEALDKWPADSSYLSVFERNLDMQEKNITEPGERDATDGVRRNFNLLKLTPDRDSLRMQVRTGLHAINQFNQQAIFRKSNQASITAEKASDWLMVVFTMLMIITLTLAFNFPGVINKPISSLTEGIRSIVKKDYSKRIHLTAKNEFGELATAFNSMAEKLDEYEHSNLAKIKFEKSRIETIINQMLDGIIGLDETNHILFVNVVAEKLLGLRQEDLAGKYAPDIAIKNDLMRTLMQENNRQKELKIYADNKESYFQLDVFDVTENQAIIGEVIILRNITPFHELSDAKTNFIATVSHELKTPIASIKISTQLLADQRVGTVNPEQKELVESINNDASRLLKITSELLNMSQVETGKIQLKIEPVPTSTIIDQAVNSVQSMLHDKQITLIREIQTPVPDVMADREKASWVLINFLTNAIKHSRPSSNIELIVEKLAAAVRFRVRDHGKGIEPRHLSKIFDRYYKVPDDESPGGSGLGLSIAKEFIEAQEGIIQVESEPGEGSTFSFSLPGVTHEA